MPYILERHVLADKQPTQKLQRLSNIPRPIKHLVLDNNNGGISHASKPTIDSLPLPTPSKSQPMTKSISVLAKSNHIQLDSDSELAILELVPFSQQPLVNFGNIILGNTRIKYIILRNPLDKQQQLFVKSFPKPEKGFYMDATEFLIAPNTEICVALACTPKLVGGFRETITLQDVNRMPKRIVLMGNVMRPKRELAQIRSTNRINAPRIYQKSPTKASRPALQDRNKLSLCSKETLIKSKKASKPLVKLQSPSTQKRHHIVRKALSRYDTLMAVKIQSYWRMIIEQRHRKQLKEAVIVLQSRCRSMIARREYQTKRRAIILLQCLIRTQIERKKFLEMREATIVIQKNIRGYLARQRYNEIKSSVVSIQKHVRGYLARKRCLKMILAAIVLQKYVRRFLAKRRCDEIRSAAIVIQKYVRRQLAMKRYLETQKAVITIQKNVRCMLAFKRYIAIRLAIIYCQKRVRGKLARKRYMRTQLAVITLQKHYRALKARRERKRLKNLLVTTIWMQSLARGIIFRDRLRRSYEAMQNVQRFMKFNVNK